MARVLYQKKEKGVSPVIATILMVAITVVLASAVYLMVSGYIGSSPSKPVALGVVPTVTATGTQFLISSGSLTVSSGTPLIITVNQLDPSVWTSPFTATISSLPSSGTFSSSNGYVNLQYSISLVSGSTSTLSAGDIITISYNGGPLPTGTTVTFTYNGNVIYSYTAS